MLIIATLFIWLSAGLAVLMLADLLLSEKQKEWLSKTVIRVWSVLDEARGVVLF
jgi:hypothetical protein